MLFANDKCMISLEFVSVDTLANKWESTRESTVGFQFHLNSWCKC